MPLPAIPPDPQPTAAELLPLRPKWGKRDTVFTSDIARDFSKSDELVLLGFANIEWRSRKKKDDPNAFLVPFITWIRNFDYREYLASRLWRDIRKQVLETAHHECAGCADRATEVHHRDYRPRVLSGEDLSPLVALCRACHEMIGGKHKSWQETERTLAGIVTKKDAARANRDRLR
jgi:hypothetical protein